MKFSRRGLPGFLLVFPIFAMLLLMQPYRTLSFAPSINLSVVSPVNNDNRNSKELRRKSLLPVRKNQERMHKTDSRLNAIMDIVGVSPEPIHTAFAFATFGPQPFWVLMILLPKNEITKKIMGTMGKFHHIHARRLRFFLKTTCFNVIFLTNNVMIHCLFSLSVSLSLSFHTRCYQMLSYSLHWSIFSLSRRPLCNQIRPLHS